MDDVGLPRQSPCHCIGAAVAIAKIMVHRILCLTLTIMCVVGSGAAQNRQDQALHHRAIRLEPFIVAAAMRYGIDARILRAICFVESGYRINVISPKGARGPMQFMPHTAARYGLRDPHDPEQAIDAAARYFRDLLKRFGGRVDLAVAAYNAGEGTVNSFMTGKRLILNDGRIVNARGVVTGGIPPYLETQRYVRSVLRLVNYSPVGPVGWPDVPSRFGIHRDLTLDTFDVTERSQKVSDRRASSFIEVQ